MSFFERTLSLQEKCCFANEKEVEKEQVSEEDMEKPNTSSHGRFETLLHTNI